ncbi:MAG: fibronectin type III domain-containing protein, partial [Oceanisphaera sp.]|nr:fibronectin type III domain-containing protein [Oceanisphaera sp.]
PEPEPEPDTLSVTLYWSVPMERANGDPLSLDEIGGYEIRYRETGAEDYVTLVINDAGTDQYLIEDLPGGDYEFQVATFDSNGIYSDFVTAQ